MNHHLNPTKLQAYVSVPTAPRQVDINEASLDAEALWHLLDHIENCLGDEESKTEGYVLLRHAVQVAEQLDRDLKALSGHTD